MPLITALNAREFAQRSAEAKRQRKAKRLQAEQCPPPSLPVADGFISKVLARTREHVGKLGDMIDRERDPMKLDRLASALSRLAELERVLSGRPLPGSFKPTAPPKARRNYTPAADVELVDFSPEPAPLPPGNPVPSVEEPKA